MVQLQRFDGGPQAGAIGMYHGHFLTLNIALRVTLEKVERREEQLRDLQRELGAPLEHKLPGAAPSVAREGRHHCRALDGPQP